MSALPAVSPLRSSYFETSALDSTNVEQALQFIAKNALQQGADVDVKMYNDPRPGQAAVPESQGRRQ